MKLGRTLALLRVGVVVVGVFGSRAEGEDLPSSEIRRRLLTGDGIVSFTIGHREIGLPGLKP
jgi:hypothetical protein